MYFKDEYDEEDKLFDEGIVFFIFMLHIPGFKHGSALYCFCVLNRFKRDNIKIPIHSKYDPL